MAKNLARSLYSSQNKPIEATIKGDIPKWINGTLFRNGPGRFRFGNKIYNHFFDGMACINKFEIKNGKVYYSNKILDTEIYQKTLRTKKLQPLFGHKDPCTTFFGRFKVIFQDMYRHKNDNVNINVVPFSFNQLYALTESSVVVRIDPKTLNIINQSSLLDYIKPTITTLAHPHIEEDGSWLSIGLNPKSLKISYDIMKFNATKNIKNACENVKLLTQIPTSHKFGLSYFHSFGLSKKFYYFLEQSLIIDIKSVIYNILIGKPIANALKIDPNFPTKIYLIDRKTGQLLPQKFYTDPQFTFHHINAFEINDTDPSKTELFIDICSYKADTFSFDTYSYDENDEDQMNRFFDCSKSYPCRIHVPLYKQNNDDSSIYCKLNCINSEVFIELPTINYFKYNTKPYNYVYGISSVKKPNSIVKINVNKLNVHQHSSFKTDNRVHLLSEPVFVEHPEAEEEDAGALLAIVLGDKYDSLVILDAKSMEEIACAELPEDIKASFTFHGFFADNKMFNKLN